MEMVARNGGVTESNRKKLFHPQWPTGRPPPEAPGVAAVKSAQRLSSHGFSARMISIGADPRANHREVRPGRFR